MLLTILIHVVTSIFADDRDKATEDNHVSNAAAVDSSTIAALTRRAGEFKMNDPADLDSAIFYLKQALWLARESTSTSYLYSVYDQYSRVFMKSGNFSLALEYYYKMLKLLDDEAMGAHDQSALYQKYASLYTHIGNCYFSMDNFKSLDFYRKSLEMVKKLSEIDPDYPAREREMINYINIGSAYLNNYNFMEAEINFIKALELSETLDNPVNEGTLYNNLGIVYKEKKDFDKAFEYYQRSLSIRLEYKDSIGLAQTYNNLGDAYILTGQNKTAIGVLEKAVQMSRQTGNLRSGMKAANFLSIAYENVGEIARAYDMFKVYSTLHDSIINQEAVQNSLRLEMQYQYDKQIRENELQQELLLAKKERKSLIYMIISGILLFSVTILVLLSRNQRMRIKQALLRKDRLELERKTLHLEKENLLIEKQKLEMELDFRNKELSTHVIYLLKKNEFISSIIEKLLHLRRSSGNDMTKEAWIQDILREMQSNVDSTVWNEFEVRFQQVHNDFYQRLAEKYPDLTPNEIKICAFLKLNMTSKDISAITFQSVKSIEVARHRLRKKLGIERDENLVTLLQQL